ncbi:GNAT family N-acetyltransferase [Haloprofundus salinisoli]|uniref:GNAT family N-acetyltransferase n=1 Tax=Haloprofundus salinisoli TaxID=2876193 RepID=UPI001CCCF283|nr:GNAT family N-acetyltransferase [Haloprofundus salinisoli]
MNIRTLEHDDVTDALALSTQAGWNQLPVDWHRLLNLAPESCFGGWVGDDLVATATLATYDETVGWIGMVLVEESHRRQGYGMEMFERVLDIGRKRGLDVGLDATDAGRAVYKQVDFVDVAPIERWVGTPTVCEPPSALEVTTSEGISTTVERIDRHAVGVDRTALLDAIACEEDVSTLVISGDNLDGEGYAVIRPGRQHCHIGPFVSTSPEVTELLLQGASNVLQGESAIVDLLPDAGAEKTLFSEFGFEQQRQLTRMVYQEPLPLLTSETVVAGAGFELG